MIHPWEEFYRLTQVIQLSLIDLLDSNRRIRKPKKFEFKKDYSVSYTTKQLQSLFDFNLNWNELPCYDIKVKNIFNHDAWRTDPKSGIQSKVKFSSRIDNQDFDAIGDYRYISVLSRFHHFPFFGIIALSQKDTLRNLQQQLIKWNIQNPYLKSVNWKSGIEVGIRTTNLILSRKIINTIPESLDKINLLELIDEMVYTHYFFLKNHLSLYSSANNHLLAELLGLCLVCGHYEFANVDKIKRYYYNFFFKAYLDQTYSDGFSKEQSVHYHAEVLGMTAILIFLEEGNEINTPLFSEVLERFNKGIEILRYFKNWSSQIPHIGDSDEGQLIFPYAYDEFDIYSSLFTDQSILNNKAVTNFDIRNYLNSGKIKDTITKEEPIELGIQLYKKSGYCFFYDKEIKLIFDVGELGLSPLAAHGHADALQFILSYQDEPFIVDTGTFQYHSKYKKWRQYFRSTLAHNTISIDKKDQSRQVGRMNWVRNYKTKIEEFVQHNDCVICSATHNGYQKQGLNTIHQRKIIYKKSEKEFIIQDEILTSKRREAEFNLHFAPHIYPELDGNSLILRGIKGTIYLENPLFKKAQLTKGKENPIRGWISSEFSKKIPSYNLHFKVFVETEIKITTKITFETKNHIHHRRR